MHATTHHSDTSAAILRLLYESGPHTKQEIADHMQISLPTTHHYLRELIENKAILLGEERASTGGRRARTYICNTQSTVAIGVTIRSTEIVCIVVDSSGKPIEQYHTTIAARTDPIFYQRAALAIEETIQAVQRSSRTLLGVGFAPPEHINSAMSLDYTQISSRLKVPVHITERYCAYALAEYWARQGNARTQQSPSPSHRPMVCLYVGNHIGSAVIIHGTAHTGSIEHMCLDPEGPRCECGHTGCLNTYCSTGRLAEEGESLAGFFGVLEQGEVHHRARMQNWCTSMAQAIANIHAVLPADVILNGPIAQYLDDEEIEQLNSTRTSHYTQQPRVMRGLCEAYQDALGAALAIIDEYMCNTQLKF